MRNDKLEQMQDGHRYKTECLMTSIVNIYLSSRQLGTKVVVDWAILYQSTIVAYTIHHLPIHTITRFSHNGVAIQRSLVVFERE